MANVLNRKTKLYLESVHTPDYSSVDWIINPDLSWVEGVLNKYWKITGNNVTEMTQTEKDAVDQALDQASVDLNREGAKEQYELRLWKAFALVILGELNLLRTEHGLADRTVAQLKTAVLNKIDEV